MKKEHILLLFILFTAMTSFSQQFDNQSVSRVVVLPKTHTAQLNVVYTKVNDWEGKADFYLNLKNPKPTPIIVFLHGGSWSRGSKEEQEGFVFFFKEGFAVANMEYRLVKNATAPAAIEDTRCMIAYLAQNAAKLNINPAKIVLMGVNSGGHLALMGGFLGADKRFDANCKGASTVKIAAIVDRYGMTDLWDWSYGESKNKMGLQWLGSKFTDKAFTDSVSPITYASKSCPPTFIVHGDADPFLPYKQSLDLYNKLKTAGAKTKLMTVAGGDHGNFEKEKNTEINESIIQFLTEINLFK